MTQLNAEHISNLAKKIAEVVVAEAKWIASFEQSQQYETARIEVFEKTRIAALNLDAYVEELGKIFASDMDDFVGVKKVALDSTVALCKVMEAAINPSFMNLSLGLFDIKLTNLAAREYDVGNCFMPAITVLVGAIAQSIITIIAQCSNVTNNAANYIALYHDGKTPTFDSCKVAWDKFKALSEIHVSSGSSLHESMEDVLDSAYAAANTAMCAASHPDEQNIQEAATAAIDRAISYINHAVSFSGQATEREGVEEAVLMAKFFAELNVIGTSFSSSRQILSLKASYDATAANYQAKAPGSKNS